MAGTEQNIIDLQTQVQVLNDQVDSLAQSLTYAVTGREFTAAFQTIEKDQKQVTDQMNAMGPTVTGVQKQTNSLAIRFKRYASNERAINETASILPTQDEKDALASVSLSALNPVVASNDTRMVDARTPLTHASTHGSGAPDEVLHDALTGSGPLTHAQINDRIVIIEAKDTQQDGRIDDTETATALNASDIVALNADTLPEGTLQRIPTKEELSRIVVQYVFDRLMADVPPPSANDYMLTHNQALDMFAPKPVPPDDPAASHNIPVYTQMLEALAHSIVPANNGMHNLGSTTHAFNKVYAREFIDVDGNSIVIKDKHLGYNNTDRLRFGGDLIILDTDLAPHLRNIEDIKHYNEKLNLSINRVDKEHLATQEGLRGDLADHSTSGDHDGRYYTKPELARMVRSREDFFKSVTFTKDITSGTVDLPWNSLTGLPNNVSSLDRLDKLRGVVSFVSDLPRTDIRNGDIYVVANDNGLTSLYSVVNKDTAEYRKSFASNISHSGLKGRGKDDAHSQYALKATMPQEIGRLIVKDDVVDVLRVGLGIRGTKPGVLLDGDREAKYDESYVHSKKEGNIHNLTLTMLRGLEDTNHVIKPRHLADNVDTSVLADSFDKRYVTDVQRAAISDTANALSEHTADSDSHLSTSQASRLFGGQSTDLHFHVADRDLSNATGKLLEKNMDWDSISSYVFQLSFMSDLMSKSHEDQHTLGSHADTTVTGPELNTLQAKHSAFNDAHNKKFGGHGNEYGVADSVSRSDHKHDDRYINRAGIDDRMKDSDLIGTLRSDNDFLYIKKAGGWKKVPLSSL